MKRIPILGGVYLGSKEKVIIAEQLVAGVIARKRLDLLIQDNLACVRMAGAMERACVLAIDALQARADDDPGIAPVLDQMHAELTTVLRERA